MGKTLLPTSSVIIFFNLFVTSNKVSCKYKGTLLKNYPKSLERLRLLLDSGFYLYISVTMCGSVNECFALHLTDKT